MTTGAAQGVVPEQSAVSEHEQLAPLGGWRIPEWRLAQTGALCGTMSHTLKGGNHLHMHTHTNMCTWVHVYMLEHNSSH